MGIVYLGKDERVAAELAETKDALNARYREILGGRRYEKLAAETARLLVPESFYDDRRLPNKEFGIEIGGPNKFFVLGDSQNDFKLGEDGRLVDRKFVSAPGFYISEEAFQHSGARQFTDRRIASYVHEFNHYVWYVLQHVPMYFAHFGLIDTIPHRQQQPDFPRIMEEIAQGTFSPDIALGRFSLGILSVLMNERYEAGNHVLDKIILEAVDITVPLPWRGTPRRYAPLPFVLNPSTNRPLVSMVPIGGDPFYNLDDREVVERLLRWEDYGQLNPSLYAQNYVASLKNIRARRVPLPDILARIHRHNRTKKPRR